MAGVGRGGSVLRILGSSLEEFVALTTRTSTDSKYRNKRKKRNILTPPTPFTLTALFTLPAQISLVLLLLVPLLKSSLSTSATWWVQEG